MCELSGGNTGIRIHGAGSSVSATCVTVTATKYAVLGTHKGGQPLAVEFVNMQLSGGIVGVSVGGGACGKVSIRRCHITQFRAAVFVRASMDLSMLDSRVSECKLGIGIADNFGVLTDACELWGLQGVSICARQPRSLLRTRHIFTWWEACDGGAVHA